MAKTDDVEAMLALGELRVARALIEARLKALEKKESRTTLLRQRAILAEESAIDDDLPSLARDAKEMGEAAAQPDADDADRARWAWGLLMAGATGKARAAGKGDPMAEAGLAYASSPTAARRAALFAASKAHPERAVRLVLQRAQPVVDEALALYERRRAKAPLPDRHTLRSLRLAVAAMRVVEDPRAEALHRLDPEHALSPAQALALRRDRLAEIEATLGSGSALLLQPYQSLSMAAEEAGALEVAVDARLRIDAILVKQKGTTALIERSAMLVDLWRDLISLERFDEAEAIIARSEEVSAKRGLDVPDHPARAELFEARGDWEGCLAQWRLAVEQARVSKQPGYGPKSENLALTRDWQADAEARAAAAHGANKKKKAPPTAKKAPTKKGVSSRR